MGGLPSRSITGVGDLHFTTSVAFHPNPFNDTYSMTQACNDDLNVYGERVWRAVTADAALHHRRRFGYVPELLMMNAFHGGLHQNRRYEDRLTLLARYQFNPYTNLFINRDGLWQLHRLVDGETNPLQVELTHLLRSACAVDAKAIDGTEDEIEPELEVEKE